MMIRKILYLCLLALFVSCESSQEGKLVEAIEEGNKDKVKELLNAGADPNADASGVMGDGTTATFEAACSGDMELLDMMLEAEGKVDHVMEFGTKKIRLFNRLAFTIGHKLASCDFTDKDVENYIAMIDKVVELGADIGGDSQDDDFEVHIELDIDRKNSFYVVAASSTFGVSDIDETCVSFMKKMLKTFMKHGCDIDGKDPWSRTALTYHVQRRNIKMTELLLELGADINEPGGDMDASPLWYAKYTNIMYSDTDEIEYDMFFENDNDITRLLIAKGGKEACGNC